MSTLYVYDYVFNHVRNNRIIIFIFNNLKILFKIKTHLTYERKNSSAAARIIFHLKTSPTRGKRSNDYVTFMMYYTYPMTAFDCFLNIGNM